jgi:hypothetical protein
MCYHVIVYLLRVQIERYQNEEGVAIERIEQVRVVYYIQCQPRGKYSQRLVSKCFQYRP